MVTKINSAEGNFCLLLKENLFILIFYFIFCINSNFFITNEITSLHRLGSSNGSRVSYLLFFFIFFIFIERTSNQEKILSPIISRYGTMLHGSTYEFFRVININYLRINFANLFLSFFRKKSHIELYQRMWNFMKSKQNVFVNTYDEGTFTLISILLCNSSHFFVCCCVYI